MNWTKPNTFLVNSACSLIIIAGLCYIAQMGYRFGHLLAGH